MRPLLFEGDTLYCSRFNEIHATEDLGESFRLVGRLSTPGGLLRACRYSALAQRVLRLQVHRMRVVAGNVVLLFKGGLYTFPTGDFGDMRFFPTKGSRPISLAVAPDGPIVFGEYWSNSAREEVKVYGSYDAGVTWETLFAFPAGSIRHIHGITYDRWDDCFWVCTGDHGDEPGLYRASADFSEVEELLKGGQANRFYSVHADEACLLMATDTALAPNYIVVFDKNSGAVTRLQAIENSCFHHAKVGGHYFFGVVAEPSDVNDQGSCHIWAGSGDLREWKRVLSLPIDFLSRQQLRRGVPKGLFQYPRIFFPDGDGPPGYLVCHCIGLRGYSDTMAVFDLDDLGLTDSGE